jgi:hypothetical protein
MKEEVMSRTSLHEKGYGLYGIDTPRPEDLSPADQGYVREFSLAWSALEKASNERSAASTSESGITAEVEMQGEDEHGEPADDTELDNPNIVLGTD